MNLYAYVADPTRAFDPLGLTACGPTESIVLGEGMDRVKTAVHDLQDAGLTTRWYQAPSSGTELSDHVLARLRLALARVLRF